MTHAFRAPTGEVEEEPGLFLWRVKHGTPLFLGRYQQEKLQPRTAAGQPRGPPVGTSGPPLGHHLPGPPP